MKCSGEELIFFSSIVSKDNLFAMELDIGEEENRESFVDNTMDQLQKNGLVHPDKRLTIPGIRMLEAIVDYKLASEHVIINNMRIALVDGMNAITMIQCGENEYEVMRLPRIAIVLAVITSYPFLKEANAEISTNEEVVSKSRLLKIMREEESEKLIVREYHGINSKQEILYRMDAQGGIRYDLKTGNSRPANPSEIRRALIECLRINGEQYGRVID